MDIRLDSTTGDIDLTDNEMSLVTGIDRIKQQCAIRLRLFRGECFWDERVGMPYYQEILGIKPFREPLAVSRVRQALLGVAGVVDVVGITFDLNHETRALSGSFNALAKLDDEPILFTQDFVIG